MNTIELCAQLQTMHPPLFVCSPAPKEGIRVRTPFMYPDGGIIDVFVIERETHVEVTDFGEAIGWLRMQSFSGQLSPKQRRFIEDICLTLGVELFRGQLIQKTDQAHTAEAVFRVAQAALRVADLWFTLRSRPVETIAEEVSDWLTERHIPFDRSVQFTGRSGQIWTIDYQTRVADRTSLVFLLATGSRAVARRITDRVVAGCYDLNHLKIVHPHLQFVSLFDDRTDVWEEENFRQVQELSIIARWSRPDEVEQILRAAA